jgi:hypothetical protein
MKTKKPVQKKLLKRFRINPELNNKYNDEPLVKEKLAKARQIIKTYGLPKI